MRGKRLEWARQIGIRVTDWSCGVSAFLSGFNRGSLNGPNASDRDAIVAKVADSIVPEPTSLLFGSVLATGLLGVIRTPRRRLCE